MTRAGRSALSALLLSLSLAQRQSLRGDNCLAVLDETCSHSGKDILKRKPNDAHEFAFIWVRF